MLTSFVKKLFNYIFELFDHKVVPNFPENPPSNKGWRRTTENIKPKNVGLDKIADLTQKPEFESLRATYLNANPTSSSWSWGTWLWYGSLAVVGIGLIYVGFSLYQEPSYLKKIFGLEGLDYKGKGRGPAGPSGPEVTVYEAVYEQAEGVSSAVQRIGCAYVAVQRSIVRALNPFTYIPPRDYNGMTQGEFTNLQSDMHTRVETLYPFTTDNPYYSLWKKLRISIFGESSREEAVRLTRVGLFNNSVSRVIGQPRGMTIDTVSPVGIHSVTSVGIPAGTPTRSLYDINYASQMGSKLNSGWQTPIVKSTTLAPAPIEALPVQTDVTAWSSDEIDIIDSAKKSGFIDKMIEIKAAEEVTAAAAAQAKADQLKLEEFAKLINPENPTDFTKVRHYIDTIRSEVAHSGKNAHEVPKLIVEKLKLMDPVWIKSSYPEFDNPTLEEIADNIYRLGYTNLNPFRELSYHKEPVAFCQSIITKCLGNDTLSITDKEFLLKAMDHKVLEHAFPRFPDVTAEKIIQEPIKYLGENWAKYLETGSRYESLPEVTI